MGADTLPEAITPNSWRIVPIVVDGHKYILAAGGDNGACSICPAKSD